MIPEDYRGAAELIEDAGAYDEAARTLGCEVAALRAVSDVESRGDPFLPDGRPVLLYEAHVFSRLTKGRYNDQYPRLSSPVWDRSLYGAAGAHQYERLEAAAQLDWAAALNACSWGRFQIMGFNHRSAGHDSVDAFVAAHCRSEVEHLRAFVAFIQSTDLARFLRARDWTGFARRYNGPAFAQNGYDTKLAAAYARTSSGSVNDIEGLQRALADLGYNPGLRDGRWGPRTEGAVRAFLFDAPKIDLPPKPSREVFAAVQAAIRERRRRNA